MDPFNPEIFFGMGLIRKAVGDTKDARDCLTAAICLDENNAKLFCDFGNFFHDQNKILLALMCYLRAIRIDPLFRLAHKNIYASLNVTADRGIWAATYKKMLDQNPNALNAGPLRIRIETSSSCNLRCQHCPTGTSYKKADRQIMTMNTFDKIVSQMKAFQIITDAFFYLGGEPLLNKNLHLMRKRIKEETMVASTLFTTNAMLLDKAKCRELSTADIDQISVSIDGRSPEENDRLRKGADYKTVLKNTKLLKSYLPNTEILIANVLIKQENDPETPVVPDFLVRDFKGFSILSTYAMVWPGLDIQNSSIENISYTKESPSGFSIHPFTDMAVRPNGDVTICCYDILGEHRMGNIHETDLLTLWKSRAYTELREAMLTRDSKRLPAICRRCLHFTGQHLEQNNQ